MPRPILQAIDILNAKLSELTFSGEVACTYNPLDYALNAHKIFLKKYGQGKKRTIFLGMNPGPYGMVQTGVPFGDVSMVKQWLKIEAKIKPPEIQHPKRPVTGYDCDKSEVSGTRFWGMMADRYPKANDFFAQHFVINYCPLVWMTESGKNITPDKLPKSAMTAVNKACDEFVRFAIEYYQAEHLVGIGAFAEKQLLRLFDKDSYAIGRMLHPSPASPIANKHWPQRAIQDLKDLEVWR